MKAIVINEENHGIIGIAKDYYSAISFLINNIWLTAHDNVWDEREHKWVQICEMYGEDWIDKIFSWDIKNFNEVFGIGAILLIEQEIIEYAQEK